MESESLAVQTQTSFIKKMTTPQNIKLGDYAFYVRATYDGKIATASDNFKIVSSSMTSMEKVYIWIIIILSVIIALIVYQIILHERKIHGHFSGRRKEEGVNLGRIMRK